MTKAVNRVRKLGKNRRIDKGVVVLRWPHEDINLGLNRSCELFEDKMLVLHLGAKFRGLEQALAVPL